MPTREEMPYRDCVGIAVFNAEGLVFVGRRMPDGSADRTEVDAPWQRPQGGIDKGETPIEAAWRELFEETSIRTADLIAEAPEWIYYDLPDEALGIALKGKYRGQRQRWFAFRFTGKDSDIDVTNPRARKAASPACKSPRPGSQRCPPAKLEPSPLPTTQASRSPP